MSHSIALERLSDLPSFLALPYDMLEDQSTPQRAVYRYNWKSLYRPKPKDLWFDNTPELSLTSPRIAEKLKHSIPGEHPREYYLVPRDFSNNQPKYAHVDHWLKHKDVVTTYLDCPCRFETVSELDIALIPQPKLPDMIALNRELLSDGEIIIGHCTNTDRPYTVPFDKFTHLLVVGTSGYGKSTLLNVMMQSFLHQLDRIESLYLIDLKGGVELGKYKNASDKITLLRRYEEVPAFIEELYELVQNRLEQMFQQGLSHWPGERIILVIDEYAEIQLQKPTGREDKQRHEQLLANMVRLASLSRAAGVVIIAQTQSPTEAMIGTRVKAQLASKISFKLDSNREAQLVFNDTGHLPADVSKLKRGQFVFFDACENRTVHLQGYVPA